MKTKYIQTKRTCKPHYLIEKLIEYASILLGESRPELQEELVFFMGAMFYPKHMKTQINGSKKAEEIEIIHSSLYSFTKKKLTNLESYAAYHFLI